MAEAKSQGGPGYQDMVELPGKTSFATDMIGPLSRVRCGELTVLLRVRS